MDVRKSWFEFIPARKETIPTNLRNRLVVLFHQTWVETNGRRIRLLTQRKAKRQRVKDCPLSVAFVSKI
jgi:hypothetical protein